MSETATKTKRAPLFYEDQISLATLEGPIRVVAQRRGPLAYHPMQRWGDERYEDTFTVTHIKSGFGVRHNLDAVEARKLIRALQNLDWDFSDPAEMPAETKREAGRIIRELGL